MPGKLLLPSKSPKAKMPGYIRRGRAILIVSLIGCTAAASLAATGESFPWASSSGAWTFFSDPRALYYKGKQEKVYMAFLDQVGSDRIWSMDYASGKVDTFTLKEKLQLDDHDNPALYIRTDGRIAAFYHKHGNESLFRYRVSMNPEDITQWQPERTVAMPAPVTYAHPIRLSGENNRLYLFNRSINWHPTLISSDDEGETWNKPVMMIGGSGGRPYVKYVSDGSKRIHIAFTDGHPRDESKNSIYYAYYEKGTFYHADGKPIKNMSDLPFEPNDADKVYDGTTLGRAWIWDVALDSLGRPVLVFTVSPEATDHRYWYARWDGVKWHAAEMTKAGGWYPMTPEGVVEREKHYAGGIILDHADPSQVYLSRPIGGIFEIEHWRTPDGGGTWNSQAVTSGSMKNNARPILPWSATGQPNPKKFLFWMQGDYEHYTRYATGIKYRMTNTTVSLNPARRSVNSPLQGSSLLWRSKYGWQVPGGGEHAGYDLMGRQPLLLPVWLLPDALKKD